MEVKTLEELHILHDVKENDLVKVTDENKYYIYKNGQWEETEPAKITMSNYELNKQVYSKEKDLTIDQIRSKIKSYIYDNKLIEPNDDHEYYMLLSNELNYYTIFDLYNGQKYKTFLDNMVNVLTDFQNVKHIEPVDNALEIWCTLQDKFAVFYLFNYTQGVVKCQ